MGFQLGKRAYGKRENGSDIGAAGAVDFHLAGSRDIRQGGEKKNPDAHQ
jgi:hypothetical protein